MWRICRTGIIRIIWVELCPPERSVEVLTPAPMHLTFFGNRVLADIINLGWGHQGGCNSVWLVPLFKEKKHRNRHTRRPPCENRAEMTMKHVQVKARTTKDFWWPQKPSEEMAPILSTKQQSERGSADTSILDISFPEPWENTFLLC